ncbi:hypothetical protein LC605_05360 [Nostoc sp. CHAB 5836]|uniref:IS4/Tn5 family transposase DNA-binding protein n=1 Tax=Nostoc sp. CHAB 5836 TaxID=2780404 RepID=UPI001E42E672|nr:hypothetical protein [Nostoc sp. CHAB 5836]MCC5614515.1 hypothetical protein [Nostoc sp. CHAB 5836]
MLKVTNYVGLVGKKILRLARNGDRRLNERAMSIGFALSQGFGKGLSEMFNGERILKRAYEFLPTQKWNFPS